MTRRDALIRIVAGASGGIATACGLTGSNSGEDAPASSAWRHSLETIGACYLCENRIAMTDASQTMPAVRDALQPLGIPEAVARAFLASGGGPAFLRQIRNDFEYGRTAEVCGWVLSVTEVATAIVAWCERCG